MLLHCYFVGEPMVKDAIFKRVGRPYTRVIGKSVVVLLCLRGSTLWLVEISQLSASCLRAPLGA